MPKFPKPFFRTGRGWYVQLDGKQIPLVPGPKNADTQRVALERYHDLMARRPAPTPKVSDEGLSVAELFDKFLAWCKLHRSPRTYPIGLKCRCSLAQMFAGRRRMILDTSTMSIRRYDRMAATTSDAALALERRYSCHSSSMSLATIAARDATPSLAKTRRK